MLPYSMGSVMSKKTHTHETQLSIIVSYQMQKSDFLWFTLCKMLTKGCKTQENEWSLHREQTKRLGSRLKTHRRLPCLGSGKGARCPASSGGRWSEMNMGDVLSRFRRPDIHMALSHSHELYAAMHHVSVTAIDVIRICSVDYYNTS